VYNPEFLEIARRELGVKEVSGKSHNQRILEYHSTTTLRATTDEVPWCSSFNNWVVEQAGYTGTGSALAKSWETWGKPIDEPTVGCIAVFKRGTKAWQRHVGFVTEVERNRIRIIGGNQSNRVSEMWMPRSQATAFRVPSTWANSTTVAASESVGMGTICNEVTDVWATTTHATAAPQDVVTQTDIGTLQGVSSHVTGSLKIFFTLLIVAGVVWIVRERWLKRERHGI